MKVVCVRSNDKHFSIEKIYNMKDIVTSTYYVGINDYGVETWLPRYYFIDLKTYRRYKLEKLEVFNVTG